MRIPSYLVVLLQTGALAFAQTRPAALADSIPLQSGKSAAESTLLATPSPATKPAASSSEPTPAGATKTGAAATRRARFSAKGLLATSAKVRLLDENGKPVAVATGNSGALEADVVPGKPYLLLPSEFGRQAMNKGRVEFPGRYLNFDKNGGAASEGGLFLRPTAVPLVWNDQARAYMTELTIGYDFTDGREQPLAAPKTVMFFAEGSKARIQADTVVIKRSGTAGYERVVLLTNQLDGATLFTARAGPADELKASATVYREPGGLEMSLPSRQIDAFGLGTGSLTITLLARDGLPLAAAENLTIHLTSQRLSLPTTATLPAGQSTTTVGLRSNGYGDDEIRADVGNLATSLPVTLVLPVAAVLAAVTGGALGGVTRFLRNKGRKAPLLARRLLEGMLVGVLFVGAAWAGLVAADISGQILGTPFGAFVLAGLSGYLGCAVLDRVTERAFRSLKPA